MKTRSAYNFVPSIGNIAYDSSATANTGSGSSLTYSHTCTGTNLGLFVQVWCSSSRTISSVTYNGVAMASLASLTGGSISAGDTHAVFYLSNPSTGANNVVVTLSGTSAIASNSVSYTGIHTNSLIDTSVTATALDTGTTYAKSITTTKNFCWTLLFTREYNGRTITAGANTVLRQRESTQFGIIAADSGASISPAASSTLNLNANLSGNWLSDIVVSITPYGANLISKAYFPLTPHPTVPISNGLVSYWKLDESSGNAADNVGSNTLTNTGTVTYGTGKIGNGAIGTNTTGGYLSVANDLGFTAASSNTWNFWYKRNTSTGGYIIDNITNSTDHQRMIVYEDGANNRIVLFANGNTLNSSTINSGTFYMVTVKKTGTTWEFFVNGSSQGTVSTGSGNYNGGVGFSIANGLYTGGTQFNGTIDEVGVWSRALSADEITALYNASNGIQLDPLKIVDYSGNGNHGTATAITYPGGKFGQCAKFDGGTNFITITNKLSTLWDNPYTVSMWVKPTALDTTNGDVLLWPGDRNQQHIITSTGVLGITTYDGTASNVTGTTVLKNNQWYHVVYQRLTSSTGALYINGVSDALAANAMRTAASDPSQDFRLGSRQDAVAANFTGLIDEVIIESRAWTAAEVATYYRKSMLNYQPVARKGGFMSFISFLISDTVTTSEVVTSLRSRLFNIAETVTTSETVSALKGLAFTVYDTVTTSDTFTVVKTWVFNILETITTSEVVQVYRKWINETKNSSSWSNESKSASTFTNETKNSNSWTNESKN